METPNGGDCYQANGNEFISTDNSNTILVHGIVINQIDNLPMGHCWLEETIIRNKGTNKEFEYTICKDFSNGRNIELPKELYYLFGNIDFKNNDLALTSASFLIVILMPLTYSITNGFAAGFIVYTVLKLLKREFKDINLGLIVITLISLLVFILH